MEKELNDFKIEVLTQLAVINSKLDGYNEIKKQADEADNRSRQNEKEIESIKDNNKWAFRTSVGAIITSVVGIVFLFIKTGMGVG
ncbi:MAG: hemolysin XhlA family protein [Lachnospiraceae bacterium]|nr:hemolysin XhlA family protein [Lachnospiraceae bacterium]